MLTNWTQPTPQVGPKSDALYFPDTPTQGFLVVRAGVPRIFFGRALVRCLFVGAGSKLHLNGYTIEQTAELMDERPDVWLKSDAFAVEIGAPFTFGPPAVVEVDAPSSSTTFEQLPENERQIVRRRLVDLTNRHKQILQAVGRFDALLFVRMSGSMQPTLLNLQSEILLGKTLSALVGGDRIAGCFLTDRALRPVLLDAESTSMFSDAIKDITKRREQGARVVLVVVGDKDTGKSTLIRRLACTFFDPSKAGEPDGVSLLDLDVGQSETTPPGLMSLVHLRRPLTGHQLTHQDAAQFAHSYLFGHISPFGQTARYLAIAQRLFSAWQKSSKPGAVLLVNTQGWLTNDGADQLVGILKMTTPTYVFGMHLDALPPEWLSTPIRVCILRKAKLPKPTGPYAGDGALAEWYREQLTPAIRREVLITAYVAQMMDASAARENEPGKLLPGLHAIRPVEFDADKLTLAFSGRRAQSIADASVFAAINCQLVALCSEEDQKLRVHRASGDETLPLVSTDFEQAHLRCHGFGVVRAVCPLRKKVYLVSAFTADELNALWPEDGEHRPVIAMPVGVHLPNCFLTMCARKAAVPYVQNVLKTGGPNDQKTASRQPRAKRSRKK